MWKAVAVVRTGPVRGATGGAAGGAARGARRGGDGPRAARAAAAGRAAASACAARRQQRRCNGEEQESERRSPRRNTPNKAGTRNSTGANVGQGGARPPTVSRQLCSQQLIRFKTKYIRQQNECNSSDTRERNPEEPSFLRRARSSSVLGLTLNLTTL